MSKVRRCGALCARRAGFSLIELLVTVLLVGVGVLGAAALQVSAIQANRSALAYSEALWLGYDILDRMRANPTVAYDVAFGAPPTHAPDCTRHFCTPVELARFDLTWWKCALGEYVKRSTCRRLQAEDMLPMGQLHAPLPQGDGAINRDANGVVRVTVQWVERGDQRRSIVLGSRP